MPKGKKNGITLLILFVVFVCAIVLYFLLPQRETEKKEADSDLTEEETITVENLAAEDITAIQIKRKGQDGLSLERKEGVWHLLDVPEASLEEERVTELLDSLNSVTASKALEKNQAELSDYGLAKPAMTIEATTSDGTVHRYDLGAEVPVLGGYYGMASAKDKIYCFSEEFFAAFDIRGNSLLQVEELPQIEKENMTFIQVKNKKGDDFAAKRVAKKKRVNVDSPWNITKPYDKPLAASTSGWDTTLDYFSELAFHEMVAYHADNLAEYGLDSPASVVTVRGKEKKSLVLYIGKQDEDGFYYVKEKKSAHVYNMDAASIENMTGIDAFSVMDTYVYNRDITDINGFDVKGKKEQAISCKNSGDGENSKTIFTLNGQSVSEEEEAKLEDIYLSLTELTYTSRVKKSAMREKSDKPVLTVVFHEDGRDVTVKFLPYDGINFYIADKDGMDYFVVDKPKVDNIVEALK